MEILLGEDANPGRILTAIEHCLISGAFITSRPGHDRDVDVKSRLVTGRRTDGVGKKSLTTRHARNAQERLQRELCSQRA